MCASCPRRYESKLNGWYDLRVCRVVDFRFFKQAHSMRMRGADSQACPNGRRSSSQTVSQPCCLPRRAKLEQTREANAGVCEADSRAGGASTARMRTNNQLVQCPRILSRVALSASPGGTRQRHRNRAKQDRAARQAAQVSLHLECTDKDPTTGDAGRTHRILLVSSAVCLTCGCCAGPPLQSVRSSCCGTSNNEKRLGYGPVTCTYM